MPDSPAARRIKDAYLGLLEENPDGPITVTQIAQRAHVNRVTFYRLYETQEDVLLDILDEFDKEVEVIVADFESLYAGGLGGIRGLLEHHQHNMPTLRTILKSSFSPVLERRIEARTRDPLVQSRKLLGPDSPFSNDLFLSFYCAGIARVMCDWIRGGCAESVDEILRFLLQASPFYED